MICCYYTLMLLAITNNNTIDAFKLSNISERQTINTEYKISAELILDNFTAISGFSISGHCQLNSDTSLVRVLLIDNQNQMYLVYEDFYLTASNLDFQNMAFETAYLDSVIPNKLKIIIRDATLYLSEISYTDINDISNRNLTNNRKALAKKQRQTQEEYMIDKWNKYNQANNGFWFAGKTAISGLSYADKK